MNLTSNPTKEQLLNLFAQCTNTTYHFLWADYRGNVYLTGSEEDFQIKNWKPFSAHKCMLKFKSMDKGCSLRISATNEDFITQVFNRFVQLWKTGDTVPLRYL